MSDSNIGVNIWNLVTSSIGVLGFVSGVWQLVGSQHPETKLAELETTLKDTEALLRSVVEEGLLHPDRHVPHFEFRLTSCGSRSYAVFCNTDRKTIRLRNRADDFREETFIASVAWSKLVAAWFNGLPKAIASLCREVRDLRANICVSVRCRRVYRTVISLSSHPCVYRKPVLKRGCN